MNFRYIFLYSESCQIQWNHPFCSISKIGGSLFFSVELPKTLYFLRNSFSLRFQEKSSQIKKNSQKVFFMFCLDHFSLNCIIKMSNLKYNDPRNTYSSVSHLPLFSDSQSITLSHIMIKERKRKCFIKKNFY